jgi:hypothetical protein
MMMRILKMRASMIVGTIVGMMMRKRKMIRRVMLLVGKMWT